MNNICIKTMVIHMMNRLMKYVVILILITGLISGCGDATEPANSIIPTDEIAELDNEMTLDSSDDAGKDVLDSSSGDVVNITNPDRNSVTICMVGDILLHTPVSEAAKREDGSFDYHALFSHTKDIIEEADLAIVNQEVIIGGEELGVSGYPAFNAPIEIGDALYDTGFDVVLQATNHALDKGSKGIMNDLSYWDAYHPDVAVLGIHDSEDDKNIIDTFEIHGIKIAILNYTYGTNGIPLPENMPFAVDMLDEQRVVSDIQRAREIADFVIVCPHWGTEYNLGIDSLQKKWTDIFLENDVDLVIGTHPHVIEPIEEIHRDEDDDMLVYYSLGNFVNWTSGTGEGVANRMVGGMAQITILRSDDGEVNISDYGVTALVTDLNAGEDGVTTYVLSDYSETLAKENEIVNQDSNFTYEYCVNLCDEVWGDLWRDEKE